MISLSSSTARPRKSAVVCVSHRHHGSGFKKLDFTFTEYCEFFDGHDACTCSCLQNFAEIVAVFFITDPRVTALKLVTSQLLSQDYGGAQSTIVLYRNDSAAPKAPSCCTATSQRRSQDYGNNTVVSKSPSCCTATILQTR